MSFPRYEAYKDSGVEWLGDVPKQWETKRLGHFFDDRREKVSDQEFEPLSVTKNGVVPQLETAAKTDDNDNRKRVCAGDFVINGRSDRRGSAGISDRDGSVSLINIVLSPTSEIDLGFAHNLLRSVPFQEEFYRYGKGIVADLWSTNFSDMKNIVLAVPGRAEQTAIADFLDRETAKIDALVEEQQRLIALLKEKRHAAISHAVTKGLNPNAPMKDSGVEWLGEVPAHWAVVPLGYRYEVQLGRMLNEERATGENPHPYLRVFDVQWNSINTEDLPTMDFPPEAQSRYRLQPGDLMVNEGGSYVGRSAIWRGEIEECYYQKALHRLRSLDRSSDTAEFLLYVMEMATKLEVFVAGGNQTTIDHLPAEQLREYRFVFPPHDEQLEIARELAGQLTDLDALLREAEAGITLLQERRSALISAAVMGKIDVRGLVPVEAEAA
jgi:type I restriction enzyme, S subunit